MSLDKLENISAYYLNNKDSLDYLELGLLFTNIIEDVNDLIFKYKILDYKFNNLYNDYEQLQKQYFQLLEDNGLDNN